MRDDDIYILEIRWVDHRIDLPALVGPFGTRAEAEQWASLNTPNGDALVRPVAQPYARV